MRLMKSYHQFEMDSKVALAEMVRESIVRALKKQNVAVPERNAASSASALDPAVVEPFRYVVHLFDWHEGDRMDQDLINKLKQTPELFNDNTPRVFTALAHVAKVGGCLPNLVAYTTFMTHVCAHRSKAGFAIDDGYLDMIASSVHHSDCILDWEELRKQLVPFREQSVIVGYEN